MTKTCTVNGCEKRASSASLCAMHYTRKKRHGSVDFVHQIHGDPMASFMQKVDKSDGCWEWTGGRYKNTGYGQFSWRENGRRTPTNAHRVAWMLLVGPIPEGMFVDHICHNRGCVNPVHLRLATPKQNNENHSGRPRPDSRTGVRGVRKVGDWWHAEVQHNYKKYSAGSFSTLEAAEQAVINLRNELFTFNNVDRTDSASVNPDDYRSRRRKPGEPPPHGSTSKYRHGCRCDECKGAHRDYKREALHKKKEQQRKEAA